MAEVARCHSINFYTVSAIITSHLIINNIGLSEISTFVAVVLSRVTQVVGYVFGHKTVYLWSELKGY